MSNQNQAIPNQVEKLDDNDSESYKEEIIKKYKYLDEECERILKKIKERRNNHA